MLSFARRSGLRGTLRAGGRGACTQPAVHARPLKTRSVPPGNRLPDHLRHPWPVAPNVSPLPARTRPERGRHPRKGLPDRNAGHLPIGCRGRRGGRVTRFPQLRGYPKSGLTPWGHSARSEDGRFVPCMRMGRDALDLRADSRLLRTQLRGKKAARDWSSRAAQVEAPGIEHPAHPLRKPRFPRKAAQNAAHLPSSTLALAHSSTLGPRCLSRSGPASSP
jgi:hypothetical protein